MADIEIWHDAITSPPIITTNKKAELFKIFKDYLSDHFDDPKAPLEVIVKGYFTKDSIVYFYEIGCQNLSVSKSDFDKLVASLERFSNGTPGSESGAIVNATGELHMTLPAKNELRTHLFNCDLE